MKSGITISTVLHAIVLLWGLITFATKPFQAAATDSLAADIISATEFSQLTAGSRNAPKAEAPKPLVEKIAEAKPAENTAPKVVEKPEVIATASTPPPAPEAKPEPKHEAERKQPDTRPDPIAEALKREEARKPEVKKVETKAPLPPKKPEPPKTQLNFDTTRIAALLDKRDPQRQAAAGEVINRTASLGTATGNAPQLTQGEISALIGQIKRCWTVPAGAADAQDLRVECNIRLKPDGSRAADRVQINRGSGPFFQVFAESAARAMRQCQPYNLPSAKYEAWKDVDVGFRLADMFGG